MSVYDKIGTTVDREKIELLFCCVNMTTTVIFGCCTEVLEICSCTDQRIVRNSFQPIVVIITRNPIHQSAM